MEKLMDSFMNDSGNSFMQLFEVAREKHLLNREDYKTISDKMVEIMEEFPKARSFLQDEVITDMTDDEKDAVLRIIDLKEQIKVIEYKEAFKLGAKEMYIFLEDMDMLNI